MNNYFSTIYTLIKVSEIEKAAEEMFPLPDRKDFMSSRQDIYLARKHFKEGANWVVEKSKINTTDKFLSKEECYEKATMQELGGNPNGTRQDVIWRAMEMYANQPLTNRYIFTKEELDAYVEKEKLNQAYGTT